MNSEELEKMISSIREKLGEENSALISDDLGLLISSNNNTINQINSLNNDVKTLKEKNDNLVSANGKLLQQVPIAKIDDESQKDPEPKHNSLNLNDVFDEFGRFKKKM